MFGKIAETIQRYPIVPLVDNGRAKVYPLGIDYLCSVIRDALADQTSNLHGRVWFIQQPDSVRLRDIVNAIRQKVGGFCLVIPIPSLPLLIALSIIERLPLRLLQISTTNIRGLRQNAERTFQSDFAHFGYPKQTLAEMIDRGLGEF
ncbi:hypothetical protein KFU94_06500 [Chloroflexi bacterium TSY]|nr:hypothetical protein [Chloroflexi bacterium TSY]